MEYSALIQWIDTEETEEVIISTGDFDESEEDYIFYYFDSEQEIEEFKTKGLNEFIIIEYKQN